VEGALRVRERRPGDLRPRRDAGFQHGIRFVGETGWVHVNRDAIKAHDDGFLRDPQNKVDTMPVKLPVSRHHTRNFLDAIRNGTRPICDVETACAPTRSARSR